MSRRDPLTLVRHTRDHAHEAMDLLGSRSRDDLKADRVLNLALVRLLEIVGEAAARVPEAFRDEHSAVPWQEIADLRNRLIHGYDSVDLDVLWAIAHDDLRS